MTLLERLATNSLAQWPNDKDLISSDWLKLHIIEDFWSEATYYLLADDKGYLTFATTLDDCMAALVIGSRLRGLIRAPIHTFKPRRVTFPTKPEFDPSKIQF